ncbi:LutC/YkgG family protein [Propionicicella superfundia]|uniref:LutC/YkgG family protein n=1 Tax=Propionicicella superfundia TaxID=348582 RepID=UPI0003FCF59D|nr:LUD domain-containing protein [Propionicicella superfundia]
MSARAEVLGRIGRALADVTTVDPVADVPVGWQYGRPTPMPDVLTQFAERTADYKATVRRVPAADVPATIAELLTGAGVSSVVVPSGLEAAWRAAVEGAGVVVHGDEPPLSHEELNRIDGVVTAAAVGVAETGTIVLDHGPDQGRRALTLVPDTHLVVVTASQVVSDVPEAVVRLGVAGGSNPLTWISGPSATSDIELSRVEGVHGPRTLLVVLAE